MPNVGHIVSAPVAVVQHTVHEERALLYHVIRVVVDVRTHAKLSALRGYGGRRGRGSAATLGKGGGGGGGDVVEMRTSKRGIDT